MDQQMRQSNKLIIISRDGKSINDFLNQHNLNKDNIIRISNLSCINKLNLEGSERYVIIPPLPLCYQWAIRPLLKNLVNVTSYYNKKLINF